MRYWVVTALLFFNLVAADLAFDYLNWMRVQAGLMPLKNNSTLEKAATFHAQYLIANQEVGHFEKKSRAFYGKTPFDRAIKAGFAARFVLENISYGDKDVFASIDTLFASIYHRLAFLHPYYDSIGIATIYEKDYKYKNLTTYLLGNSRLAEICRSALQPDAGMVYTNLCANAKPVLKSTVDQILLQTASQAPKVILWPYPGAVNIPPVFYEELPDPLPECSVSGYPISVTFNPARTADVQIERFELLHVDKPVECKLLHKTNDPNKKLRDYEYVLMPLQRLKYNTEYKVILWYRDQEGLHKFFWKFQTQKGPFSFGTYATATQTNGRPLLYVL